MKDDILKILKGSVITTSPDGVYIDKYRLGCACKKISRSLFNVLFYLELIEHDSGNWETQETHYHLNLNYVSIKTDIKYINLGEITKKIEENRLDANMSSEFYDAYFSVKIDIERNQKIKKIKDELFPTMATDS